MDLDGDQCHQPWDSGDRVRALGFGALGFRALGSRALGFRALGFRALGFD